MPTLAKGKRITGSERDKLAKDLKKQYQGGASIRELANETGRSYGFIHRLLCQTARSWWGDQGEVNRQALGQNGRYG